MDDIQTTQAQQPEEVTITMPEQAQPINNTVTENPQTQPIENQPQKEELSTNNPQEVKPKNLGGRPCKYCQDKQYYQMIIDEYVKKHEESEKPTIPWIEEIALKMRIDDGTLVLWAKKLKNGGENINGESELEHPELSAAYTLLKTLQKFRLKQRAIGRFNPHGALYLLNADHKVIQTNKEILTGDKNEPLQITIVEEEK